MCLADAAVLLAPGLVDQIGGVLLDKAKGLGSLSQRKVVNPPEIGEKKLLNFWHKYGT